MPAERGAPNYFSMWGDVPIDGDVRPFSLINPVRPPNKVAKKRHHFISIAYMNGFVDERRRIHVYRSEAPHLPQPTQPAATGYENHYYSQIMPDGSVESHRFEDLWHAIETMWPSTVNALHDRRLSPAISFNIQGMATIMRARVPATRDRHAILLEAKLRSEIQALEELGALPEEYHCYAGQLDTIPIGINPQQTLVAMQGEFKDFGDLCFQLGFEVLHNRTGMPFLTSDNPVCSYDPREPFTARTPYDHGGEIELLFPIDARMMLRGSNRRGPVNVISRHVDISDRRIIQRLNRTIAQFSYRLTLAQDRSNDKLIREHAARVPTVETDVRRNGKNIEIHWKNVFGPRPSLSPYIDTPEKAARLEARMAGERSET